jgi:ribonuclease VapC
VVLDASALLAYLREEPGAPVVAEWLGRTAAISAVNWAETLAKLYDLGQDADSVARELVAGGIIGSALLIWPLDEDLARDVARLRRRTRALGLSIGDRACLALGIALQLPVLTADRLWRSLILGVEVRVIR